MTDLLPTPERQRWLLDELASLIRRRGFSTFVSAPLVEAKPEHLPEGLDEALRRLRVYAGLPAGTAGTLCRGSAGESPGRVVAIRRAQVGQTGR